MNRELIDRLVELKRIHEEAKAAYNAVRKLVLGSGVTGEVEGFEHIIKVIETESLVWNQKKLAELVEVPGFTLVFKAEYNPKNRSVAVEFCNDMGVRPFSVKKNKRINVIK